MGFFSRLFKTEEKKEPASVRIESIPLLVQPRIDQRMNEFKPSFEDFLTKLRESYGRFNSSLNSLDQATVAEMVDPQLLEVAQTNRQMFISKMRRVENKIRENPEMDLRSISDYFNSIISSVNDANLNTVKEYQSLSIVYKKELKEVLKEFKNLREFLENFGKRIRKENEHVHSNLEVIDLVDELQKFRERLKQLNDEQNQLRNALVEAQKEKDNLEKELGSLMNSEEWVGFLELRKNLNKNELALKELISEVVQVFGSVERPLKKFKKHFDNKSDIIEQYINSPYDAFTEDKSKEIIMILKNLIGSAETVPELKGETKGIEKVKSIIDSNVLESLWQKNYLLISQIRKNNLEIQDSEILKKKNHLERDSFSKLQFINSLEKQIPEKSAQISRLKEEIEKRKNTIQEKLQILVGNQIIIAEN